MQNATLKLEALDNTSLISYIRKLETDNHYLETFEHKYLELKERAD